MRTEIMKIWMKWAAVAVVGAGAVAGVAPLRAGADDVGKKMIDPVSGKSVTVAKETPFVTVNGANLYFTDAKGRETFLKTPETYLKTPLECPVRNIKGRADKGKRV